MDGYFLIIIAVIVRIHLARFRILKTVSTIFKLKNNILAI